MPSRRNGQSNRRWYHRICLASSVDSSDSSQSETHDFRPPADHLPGNTITMPSRRNGHSNRRWYHRICLASSADSSDSSESGTHDFRPPTDHLPGNTITMPSRRNGHSNRRWYHRICLASSADSSDSSQSEIHYFRPPADIGDDRPLPLPEETLSPAIENVGATPHASRSATEYDWRFHRPPPPPPPFILDQLPQRHPLNHDQVRLISVYTTEISGVEDGDPREVVRNMEITEAITRERTICPICKEEFKSGEVAGKLACDHFFCSDCIHGWINFKGNNTCPVCRRNLPPPRDHFRSLETAVPPPPLNLDNDWQYFFPTVSPPVPVLTESQLVADETESSPSISINNSEAGYDTARDELDGS